MIVAPILGIAALIIGALGAIWDVAERRLPNVLCVGFAIAGAVTVAYAGGWSALGSSAVHATIALLVGMGLFSLGWIGGGDAKFYAAAALSFPLGVAFNLLIWTTISGFVLAMLFVIPGLFRISRVKISRNAKGKIPYGVAIFLGFCLAKLNVGLIV